MKAKLKTKKTEMSVDDFINNLKDEKQKADSKIILKLMEEVSNEKPKMWGTSIIGFGDVHLKYETGRELDWFKFGFSPRKQNLTLYVLKYDIQGFETLLNQLGKHSTSKSCLYIKTLSDIDLDVLKKIFQKSLSL
jgi:hypothetical protein